MDTTEDLIKVPWGIMVPPTAKIAWGARAIKEFGRNFELLRDRQGWYGGTEDERENMSSDMNSNVLPILRDKTHHLFGDDKELYEDEISGYRVVYTCGGSHGYLYMSVYKE